jgi:type III restriction enzyme
LFIEPKGDGFIDKDEWKEEFLMSIRDNCEIEDMYEDDKFELVGLPFYNENMKSRFEEELGNVLDIESLY